MKSKKTNKWEALRNKLKLSQKEFSILFGVSQATVARWELKEPVVPENIRKLNVLLEEASDPKRLEKLKKALKEEGVKAIAPILSCAGVGRAFGKKSLIAAASFGAIGGIGLFGAGLLALGGAYGTYKLLKTVFEPADDAS